MVDRIRNRHWIIVGLLALLWHVLLFTLPWQWIFNTRIAAPPRVEIQQIDPQKLDAIRRQWKREKTALISKDNTPSEAIAPKDANYISDKNRSFEREQRARDTDILPHPGSAAMPARPRAERAKPFPNLSQLGVPLNVSKPLKNTNDSTAQQSDPSHREAKDQSVLEDNLPVGAENMLNSQQSVYYSFYARLYESVGPIWKDLVEAALNARHPGSGRYITDFEVILDRAGNLIEFHYLRSSGVSELDQAVESAWRRVQRFPNPPLALVEADGYVHIGLGFLVDVGERDPSMGYRRNY